MFINRATELAFLNEVLTRQHPGPGQLVMMYGRRRVGKTALLRAWAELSGVAFTYWVAEKDPAPLQRRKFFGEFLQSIGADLPVPLFESWSDLWRSLVQLLAGRRHLIILDELPYAAESDPAMLSALQHAWDQLFQQSQAVIVICGSHVRTMELLLGRQSPLFGRMTGQWNLLPLAFGTLRQFLPAWSPEEQVAAYAIVGGIPAYLSWLNPRQTLTTNIKHVMLAPGSLVLAEATFLLQDEVREPRPYLAVLQALGNGHHTLKDIANASMIDSAHLSFYLSQLQELRLVERRLPATLTLAEQRRSRMGRYHLSDPFLRFYFRFLAPAAAGGTLSYRPERVLPGIQSGLRAFVGGTAWEELARQWADTPGSTDQIGFQPQAIGSHWSRKIQVDVVAVDWQNHHLLLGECKWTADPVDRKVVRELIEQKTPLVLADMKVSADDWTIRHAIFARAGVTEAAKAELAAHSGILVDLDQLYAELHEER
ncbi:MAG: ATP-binding protein [Chloroflexales bacterium]|nr:ATP-binding protein [Chloroflexales bacterium]